VQPREGSVIVDVVPAAEDDPGATDELVALLLELLDPADVLDPADIVDGAPNPEDR
jgi:hypothetical protein